MSSDGRAPRTLLLVGGLGTRLRPFTVTFPKALMPLDDVPILEVLIRQLARHGLTDVTLALGHLSELIEAYVRQRPQLASSSFTFLREERPLGTAGALALLGDVEDTFLAMNGDILTTLDFTKLIAYHREQDAILTIATHARTERIDLGVIETDDRQRVVGYYEKPTHEYMVSMGIYVYEPSVLTFIHPGERLDFPDLVLRLLDAGQYVQSYPTDCLWLDIGRPDDYALAQDAFGARREEFLGG